MGESEFQADAVLNVARGLLARAYESSIRIDAAERLTKPGRRNILWRLHLEQRGAGIPGTVLVKQRLPGLYDSSTPDALGTREFLNDWAALRFLGEVFGNEQQFAPRFISGDVANGVLVMEDLGAARTDVRVGGRLRRESPSMVQPLLGSSAAAAERYLFRMMRLLGRLHAGTAIHLDAYRSIRRELDLGYADAADNAVRLRFMADAFAFIGAVDVAPQPGLDAEVASLEEALVAPGLLLVFGHGDPCPDNWLEQDGELRLIDFEFAGLQHALLDASYARSAFPTCWCCRSLPADTVGRLELAYREEASAGVPELADDATYSRAVVDAAIFWALHSLRWGSVVAVEDKAWGTASTRARILFRLGVVEGLPEVEQAYPALATTIGNLRAVLVRKWGDLLLPTFPALGGSPA
jgi:hypothetical protein